MNQNAWLENLVRPLLIGVMFGCLALSLIELVHLFSPTWNATFLVAGCVLAAVEANYSYRLIRARSLRGTDLLRFRVIELLLFFILLKAGSYLGERWADVLADIQTWPRYPLRAVDLETTVAFILALFSWRASTETVRDIERLGAPPEWDRNLVPPLESLTQRFFWGGAVLLVTTGLTRIGIAQLLDLRRPSVPGLVLNVLVYFLLGLIMLGQVRFAMLHRRWQAQKIKIADELGTRWLRYSVALIGLAALLAFLLPTGYTMGLLEAAGFALSLIIGILSFLVLLFSMVILYPLEWLLSKLFGTETNSLTQGTTLRPVLPPESGGSAGPVWWEAVRSLLFWGVALGMVFYVVRGYLRDRPELLEMLGRLGPIRLLCRLWSLIRSWLGSWAKAVGERIPRGLPLRLRRDELQELSFRLFRLGALSPRERILYYYLSILKRATRAGIGRQPAQTPNEYGTMLQSILPGAQDEMKLLTQAFVEARYSQHTVGQDDAKRVRVDWQRVKAAMRRLREKSDPKTMPDKEVEPHGPENDP